MTIESSEGSGRLDEKVRSTERTVEKYSGKVHQFLDGFNFDEATNLGLNVFVFETKICAIVDGKYEVIGIVENQTWRNGGKNIHKQCEVCFGGGGGKCKAQGSEKIKIKGCYLTAGNKIIIQGNVKDKNLVGNINVEFVKSVEDVYNLGKYAKLFHHDNSHSILNMLTGKTIWDSSNGDIFQTFERIINDNGVEISFTVLREGKKIRINPENGEESDYINHDGLLNKIIKKGADFLVEKISK